MTEIEVKAQLKDKKGVMEKLTALGCTFSDPKTQDDTVWVEQMGTMETFLSNKVFLRVRIQNGEKIILTAKKSKEKTGNGSLVKREHEVLVDSAQEAEGILEMLGLCRAVRTVKKRQTAHYKEYEICIDEIEHLGAFIEIERIGEKEEAENIQKEMIEFLISLGVREEDRVQKGYDILMLEENGPSL